MNIRFQAFCDDNITPNDFHTQAKIVKKEEPSNENIKTSVENYENVQNNHKKLEEVLSKNIAEKEEIYFNADLPSGWKRLIKFRKLVTSTHAFDTYIISPDGKRFRSKPELQRWIKQTGAKDVNISDFNFTKEFARSQLKKMVSIFVLIRPYLFDMPFGAFFS